MKRSSFILTALGVNLFLVFFLIYKNSRIVALTFQKQQQERTKLALLKEQERLQQKLCVVQNKAAIKQFAQNELKMEKVSAQSIKSLPKAS